MRTHYLTLGLTLFMLTGVVGAAHAKDQHDTSSKAGTRELPWKTSFSGSVVNTQSDTNGDGNKGGVSSTGIKGSLGSGTARVTSEFAFSGPGTCPNGNAGLNFTLLPGTGHGIFRFDSTGDLLFTKTSSATLCFDPLTTIQFFSGAENITGGTGRFAGAAGSTTYSGTATTLFDDGAGNFFAELSGTIEGTIILMK